MRIGTDNGIPFRGFPVGASLGHCSARRVAHHLAKGGTPALYLYNFARATSDGTVGHGAEVPFVFDVDAFMGLLPGNWRLATAMINYWTRFAENGSPSGDTISQTWPIYQWNGTRSNIVFDANFFSANISVDHGFRGRACNFWDRLAAQAKPKNVAVLI